MSRKVVTGLVIGLSVAGLLASAPTLAQDGDVDVNDDPDALDREPRDCITLRSIRRTEVIDDSTILFHLRGGTILRNSLPTRCPDLEHEDRFSYRVATGRLCRIDTITVLRRIRGGPTCRLGRFLPITAEEAEDLKALSGPPIEVEVTPVEIPEDEQEP